MAATLFVGCAPSRDRDEVPALHISPSIANPGDWILATLSIEGADFTECDTLEAASLAFSGSSQDTAIEVTQLQLVEGSNAIEAAIKIDPLAPVDTYDIALRCNTLSLFKGTFQVVARTTNPTISVDPASLPAGAQHRLLTLSANGSYFVEDLTYVLFGDGQYITVLSQEVPEGNGDLMRLTVNISPSSPPMKIPVVAVTGSLVANGELEITEQIEQHIWIENGKEVERPTADEGAPRQYTLNIRGTGVSFAKPAADAGPDDPNATYVTFPHGENNIDSPGIVATAVDVNDQDDMDVNIAVYDYAYIGVTRLRVTTGDQIVETSLEVVAAEGDPVLQLSPKEIQKGLANQLVLAKAKNFEFTPPLNINCLESECTAVSPEISTPLKQIVLGVAVNQAFSGSSVTLEVTTPEHIVRETLLLIDSEEMFITPLDETPLIQGSTNPVGVRLGLTGGIFGEQTAPSVLPRSGIEIHSFNIDQTQTILNLFVNVAKDAPVGPALIRVNMGATVLETLLTIQPSGNVAAISLNPNWIPQGRRTAVLEIGTNGFTLDEAMTSFLFDDPAIELLNFQVNQEDMRGALLEVSVSPRARSDMAVLYVKTGDVLAAASFRVLAMDAPRVVDVNPPQIQRGTTQVVRIKAEDIAFGAIGAEVMSDINVTVDEVTRVDAHLVDVTLTAAPTGPVGWIGVLLMSDWQRVVAPIRIAGTEPETLTMAVFPKAVPAGSRPIALNLVLPTQTSFIGLSEAATGDPGTHATVPEFDPANPIEAIVDFDVVFALGMTDTTDDISVPLYVTTARGAAVGFVDVEKLETRSIAEGDPWDEALLMDQSVVLEVESGTLPAILYASEGRSGVAAAAYELISPNGLNTAMPIHREFIWMNEDGIAPILASPAADPTGLPIDARVKSLGRHAISLEESASQDPEWVVETDLCAAPLLARGQIDGALDVDRIVIEETGCPLTAVAIARSVVDRAWVTPDAWLELRNEQNQLIDVAMGWPTPGDSDPRLYIDAGLRTIELAIGAQCGSAGAYLLNIRRATAIREISRSPEMSYVEIETRPGEALTDLVLELVDGTSGSVLESVSLSDYQIVNDGIIVIAGAALPEADVVAPVAIFPDTDPFALRLLENGIQTDAVQVGVTKSGIGDGFGEGTPIEDGDTEAVYTRIVGIDTNDNRDDFITIWQGSPGR
ncbi:MAG: hypothetical protein QNJ97_24490 [Myxococcota bacterium]|nr:hypothetical protein [Myxococcota bacterium]